MTSFEDQLRQALTRKEPPPNFAARVMERAKRQESVLAVGWQWLSGRAWTPRLVPVMAALLLVGGAAFYREHQRATEGEAAKEKLLVAVRIAGSKLQKTQQQVMKIQFGRVNQ
ncbi:MAG: hypothetical protein JOY62_07510 [Acidobacteriaceae bacterium]|nr:hypothetical protein [Acidobacteriaceae bacterium]MBV9779805.1 hypothetical protein [Acidobacteriaceae bacterium]